MPFIVIQISFTSKLMQNYVSTKFNNLRKELISKQL